MEQIPLFENEEQKVNPLNDSSKIPDFSLFPDSESVIDVKFVNDKWVAIYKTDDPGEMYR